MNLLFQKENQQKKRNLYSWNNMELTEANYEKLNSITKNEKLKNTFKVLAVGYFLKATNEYRKSIRIFEKLEKKYQNSSWVQRLIAQCYYELGEYNNASDIYKKIISLQPYSVLDMDIFSTTLLQLQNSSEMSWLAEHMKEIDPEARETYIVLANDSSLKNDHSSSIIFLKKAISIDRFHTYSLYLLGFEYLEIGQVENAENCFRKIVAIKENSYSAYYGLGMVYSKKNMFSKAKLNFQKSLRIKGSNTICWVFLGISEMKRNKFDNALMCFNKGLEFNPRNGLALIKKAECLNHLERFAESLDILQLLMADFPKESYLYKVMGFAYKGLNQTERAIACFHKATFLKESEEEILFGKYDDDAYEDEDEEFEDMFDST